eukprot:752798_1
MISLTRAFLPRTAVIAPRIIAASGANRYLSMARDLAMKERVEEDRYIRSKEHGDYLKRKRAEAAAAPAPVQLSLEEEAAMRAHEDAVDEAFEILSKTGCQVTDGTVEALADWKLGKK